MNEPELIKAKIKQLYKLKVDLEEALYQPDPQYYDWLCERFNDLKSEIEELGGVIPDNLL